MKQTTQRWTSSRRWERFSHSVFDRWGGGVKWGVVPSRGSTRGEVHRSSIFPMKMSLFNFIVMSTLLSAGILRADPIGEFDDHGDIGAPKLAGSASYDVANQEYTISGSGTNMWFTSDQFHFVWKKMSGDFILRTRVKFLGKGVVEHRKAGWMVRPNL